MCYVSLTLLLRKEVVVTQAQTHRDGKETHSSRHRKKKQAFGRSCLIAFENGKVKKMKRNTGGNGSHETRRVTKKILTKLRPHDCHFKNLLRSFQNVNFFAKFCTKK